MLIDSPELAADLLDMLDYEGSSWRLRLNATGDGIEWVHGSGEQQQVLTSDPEASLWRHIKARLIGRLLPEDWLLAGRSKIERKIPRAGA